MGKKEMKPNEKQDKEKVNKKKISRIKIYEIDEYIIFLGQYDYMKYNSKQSYHVRIYTRDYLNITGILKRRSILRKVFDTHAVSEYPENIHDTQFIEYLINNINSILK